MTTFTKTFTVTDETGAVRTFDHIHRKMDEKTFKHYAQNPLGMDVVVRKEMGIPDNRYYSVSMWPEDECLGVVSIIPNMTRTTSTPKISKSDQPTT